jgi:hypothetical protein
MSNLEALGYRHAVAMTSGSPRIGGAFGETIQMFACHRRSSLFSENPA